MDGRIVLCIVGVLALLFILAQCLPKSDDEKYTNRFSTPAYKESCEFQPACLWDTARWVQMSDGTEGVCTLHGLACPAFSKDHNRARYAGLSPPMVDDMYLQRMRARAGYSGETALDMLV